MNSGDVSGQISSDSDDGSPAAPIVIKSKPVSKPSRNTSRPGGSKNAVMPLPNAALAALSSPSGSPRSNPGGGGGTQGLDEASLRAIMDERARLDQTLARQRQEIEDLKRAAAAPAPPPPPPQQQQQQQHQQQLLTKADIVKQAKAVGHDSSHASSSGSARPLHEQYPPPPPETQHPPQHPPQHMPPPPPSLPHSNGPPAYLSLPSFLWDGLVLTKYPYNNPTAAPHPRTFALKHGVPDAPGLDLVLTGGGYDRYFCAEHGVQGVRKVAWLPLTLVWYDGKKHKSQPRKTAGKEVPLSEVVEVKRGHATATFWAAVSTRGRDGVVPDDRCFSLEADDRSVDCGCPDPQTADAFLAALERALRFFDSRGAAPPPEFEDMEGGHENNLPYNEAENKPRLFAAVKRDDLNEVERHFVSLNCPVDIMEDYSGDTVLLASCRMGRITIVQLALQHGARNDPHPDFGQTALQAAVSSGQSECARIVLETAAPSRSDVVIVNHEDSNREAPIHVASRTGNLNILRTLVSHGANMHLVDSAGRSCLHCAAMGGHTPCLAYLLDAGGDALIEERDHHGRTALHLAVKANKIEAVRLLLETAADVDAVTPDGQTCRQIARAGHFHTLARLLAEYETGNDDGGGGDSDAGPYGYNSSSDVEMLSANEASLPRPHTSVSPSLHKMQSGGGSSKSFDFSSAVSSPHANAAAASGSASVWSSQGSNPAPHTPSAPMFKGLDTFDVAAGTLMRRSSQGSAGSFHSAMNGMGSPVYGQQSQAYSGYQQPQPQHYQQQQQQQQQQPFFQSPTGQQAYQQPFSGTPQQQQQQQPFAPMASARDMVRGGNFGTPQNAYQNANYHASGYASDTTSHHRHSQAQTQQQQQHGHGYVNSPQYGVQRSQSAGSAGGGGYSSDTGYMSGRRGMNPGADDGYSSDTFSASGRQPAYQHQQSEGGYSSDVPAPSRQQGRFNRMVSTVSSLTTPSMSPHGEESTVDSFDCRSPTIEEQEPEQEAEGGGEEESFHLGSDLWNVYESEGYPYYLRMRDNHSQWDDPRTVGVDGEEEEGGGQEHEQEQEEKYEEPATPLRTPVSNPHVATPVPSFYTKPAAMVSPHDSPAVSSPLVAPPAAVAAAVASPKDAQPLQNPLTSPTMTSPSKAGVGATFIKLNTNINAADAKQTFLSAQPIHAETKNAPLRISPSQQRQQQQPQGVVGEQKSAEEVFAEAKSDEPEPVIAAEAKEEFVDASTDAEVKEEKKEPPESRKAPVAAKTKEELAQDSDLAKYVRQAKMGVPPPAIVNKMRGEKVDAGKVNDFCRAFGLDHLVEEAGGGGAEEKEEEEEEEEEEEPVLTKEELAQDPDLGKFVRQSKMGVPPQAILNKMRGEGVAADKIESFERTFGLATPKKAKKSSKALPPRRTTVKMQKIHWNAVDESKLEGSVWGQDEEELGKADIEELEGLFGEAKMGSPKGGAGKKAGGKKAQSGGAKLVDEKRAYNVNIGLAQFKSTFGDDYNALVTAIMDFDAAKLGGERANNLKSLLPTEREIRDVQFFKGDESTLGKCERFFLAVARADGSGKKIALVVAAMNTVIGFNDAVAEVESASGALGLSCDQIVKSSKLGVLLKKVLAVGNLMNESVGKPKASGITLDSLLKTAELKGKDKKTTVLDYVVKMIGEKGEEEGVKMLSGLAQEMGDLAAGARCKGMKEMRAIVQDLKEGVASIEKMLQGEVADKFRERAEAFVSVGGGKVGDMEGKVRDVEEKVKALCGFFAEDYERCDPANVIKVLLQFIRMVGMSWETYQRKARAAARAKAMPLPKGPPPTRGGLKVDTSFDPASPVKRSPARGQFAGNRRTPTEESPGPAGGGRFNQDLLKKAMEGRRRSIQPRDSPEHLGGRGSAEAKGFGAGMNDSFVSTNPYGDAIGEGKEEDGGDDTDSSDDWLDAKD